ncbi:MAG: thiolase family protein [Anaerolineales bacterium]
MHKVAIVSAVRTPIGNFGGALINIPAAQLGETAARAAIERAGITPEQVDESIFGCARQAGIGPNLARQIAWRVKMPQETVAFTVNKACGSGMKAITLGAQSIMLGENQVVLAGGVEQMSQIPYLLPKARWGYRLGDGELIDANYRDGYNCPLCDMVMGETVDRLAEEYQISREQQDEFTAESHQKAVTAWETGAFNDEVVPVEVPGRKGAVDLFERDERPRPDSTPVLMRADAAEAQGIEPLGVIEGFASGGVAPERMGLGPVLATRKLLEQTGFNLDDFGLIELNEAFAAQVLIVEKELDWDVARRNVHGGAVALGHPTGCTGARILVTLLHAMRQRDVELGLATLCISGGLGMSVAVSR